MKALIVVDMQKDFVTGVFGTPEAKAIVPNVVEKLKAYRDKLVIFTRDVHVMFEDMGISIDKTIEEKTLPPHCIYDTDGAKMICDLLAFRYGDTYSKSTFMMLDLPEFIQYHINTLNVTLESIELVGLCTDICVLSNALLLRSSFPNIPIIVDSNCCAGTDKKSHEMALKIMKKNLIEVI